MQMTMQDIGFLLPTGFENEQKKKDICRKLKRGKSGNKFPVAWNAGNAADVHPLNIIAKVIGTEQYLNSVSGQGIDFIADPDMASPICKKRCGGNMKNFQG